MRWLREGLRASAWPWRNGLSAGIALGEDAATLAIQGGRSFWALVPFTMQMVRIIIGGHVVASTPAVYGFIFWIAGIPPGGAIALARFSQW